MGIIINIKNNFKIFARRIFEGMFAWEKIKGKEEGE